MSSLFTRWKLVLGGMLLLWAASIALAFQLQALLTPGNYPIGSDPSFYICVAVFFFVLCVLGALLIWRGLLDGQNRLESRTRNIVNFATYISVGLLVIVFVSGSILFSANRAFLRDYQPLVADEPRPDYSFPVFPTPFDPQPTPTDVPGAPLLSGNLLSTLDGLRIGDISISLSPAGDIIEYIQLHIYRITCRVQTAGSFTEYAVDENKQLIRGPIRLQNRNFYVAQGSASIQGIFGSPQSAHGSLYLHFTDPSSNQSCDFGSFTWSASPI
jgi:hypothetical protein